MTSDLLERPASAPRPEPPALLNARELALRLGESHPPTPEQAAVIESELGPRAVLAGAGSGKTQTMGMRVAWLVANGLVTPAGVLGLTFTRKAAGELSARIRRLLKRLEQAGQREAFLPDGVLTALRSGEPNVSTYHAYAGRVVAEHAIRLGIEPTARLLSEAMRWQYADEVVSRYDGAMDLVTRAPSTVTLDVLALSGELCEHLGDVDDIDQMVTALLDRAAALPQGSGRAAMPAALRDFVQQLRSRRQLLPLVRGLAELKRSRSALDFGDQVALAARLVAECPEVVRAERERYSLVLLDEYQDTGEAQRRLLATTFGAGFPVVAVGDPRQSIYGWRGASAGNLQRFPADFPTNCSSPARPEPGGLPLTTSEPAPVSSLSVSFRNGAGILAAANRIAADIPLRGVAPEPLVPGPGKTTGGRVRTALLETWRDEAAWVAAQIADLGDRLPWGEVAVLARRRSSLLVVEEALREAGVPCEVVGLGGLLSEPEVADVVCTLRVLVDPLAGNALMRILTGPRWRLGPRDLAALAARARHLERTSSSEASDQRAPLSLVEALDDMGAASAYSEEGYTRLRSLQGELRELRRDIGLPLPELLTSTLRMLRLHVELPARAGSQLDALANLSRLLREAAEFADSARAPDSGVSDAGLRGFLAYLDAADEHDRGLEREVPDVESDRVQLLTVHGAKGLEWDAVFVVGLTEKVFPVEGQAVADWTRQVSALPFPLRGDRLDLPDLDLSRWTDRQSAADELKAFQARCKDRSAIEERRLAYVAVTRARELLVCSGYWWDTATRPRGPSVFLREVHEVAERLRRDERSTTGMSSAPGSDAPVLPKSRQAPGVAAPAGQLAFEIPASEPPAKTAPGETAEDPWADLPVEGAANPLADQSDHQVWPAPPPAAAPLIHAGAAVVRRALAASSRLPDQRRDARKTASGGARVAEGNHAHVAACDEGHVAACDEGHVAACDDRQNPALDDAHVAALAEEVDLLLAERRDRAAAQTTVELPAAMSVSALVALQRDPEAYARQLRRPVPLRPQPVARRGTRFHAWLEHRWGQQRLLDVDQLPGAADDAADVQSDLAPLQRAFAASVWAARTPREIEFPFEVPIAGLMLRGRIDAVFVDDPDGGVDIVDWKTGPVPSPAELQIAATQLAVYRLAWHAVSGVDLDRIRAAFHYVADNVTVRPADLLGADDLRRILGDFPLRDKQGAGR